MVARRRVLKFAISCFILLNLGTVLYSHRPRFLESSVDSWMRAHLDRTWNWRFRFLGWAINLYGYRVGLNNRWEMFSFAYRRDFYLRFTGVSGKTEMRFPIPGQTERTFWEKHLFDSRVSKFHLNIYGKADLLGTYSHYLCRTFPLLDGKPIESVRVEVETREFMPLSTAMERNVYRAPSTGLYPMGNFPCN